MLDYAQSFEEFSSSLKPIDLALYAGIGLVLWVLFKDKLSPVQILLGSLVDKIKNLLNKNPVVNSSVTYNTTPLFNKPEISPATSKPTKEDLFFKLIVSWKETRDLARSCGCDKAVEVADSMFPYLSPNVCAGENKDA
jgi:hypothetical protein